MIESIQPSDYLEIAFHFIISSILVDGGNQEWQRNHKYWVEIKVDIDIKQHYIRFQINIYWLNEQGNHNNTNCIHWIFVIKSVSFSCSEWRNNSFQVKNILNVMCSVINGAISNKVIYILLVIWQHINFELKYGKELLRRIAKL